jgi:23S rRNA U2552 (ribose-2'-O)-methylase RlmE/FtsJ
MTESPSIPPPSSSSPSQPPGFLGTLVSVSSFFENQFQASGRRNLSLNKKMKMESSASKLTSAPPASQPGLYWLPDTQLPGDKFGLCHWSLPVSHLWPTDPHREKFVENAAQGLFKKFGTESGLENILCAESVTSLKAVSSNLRGRLLQVFDPLLPKKFADYRNNCLLAPPNGRCLWVMVSESGIYAGKCSPQEAGSFWPLGRRYVSAKGPSRAGGKWVEFSELCSLYFGRKPTGTWLELGSAPGGVTSEMIEDGLKVVAVDRANMDDRVLKSPQVKFIQADSVTLDPTTALLSLKALNTNNNLSSEKSMRKFDGLFCDMNSDPTLALEAVERLMPLLEGPFGITIKLQDPRNWQEMVEIFRSRLVSLGATNLQVRHLWHNRSELTLLGLHSSSQSNENFF